MSLKTLKKSRFFICHLLLWLCSFALVMPQAGYAFGGFYFGVLGGYAATTWRGLLSNDPSLVLALPAYVNEGGAAYGLLAGLQLMPHLLAEFNYIWYPTADIAFGKYSDYTFLYNVSDLKSKTRAYSVALKFLVPVKGERLSVFALAGAARVNRSDLITHISHWGATFGAGILCNLSRQVFVQLQFQYITGMGKPEELPVVYYIPFLYSLHGELAYRIVL